MKTPMINHQIKLISILLIILSAIAVASAAVVRADGILTAQEQDFGDAIAGHLCTFIDRAGVSEQSMADAITIIYRNTPVNMDMSDAVDIINYSVSNYCPEHWDELVAFGEGARSQGV